MATHSSTLAWKIPWMEEPGKLQSMVSQSQTQLSNFTGSHLGPHGVLSALCSAWVLVSHLFYTSVQFSSVAQSCPTLCDPMNRSTPGLPVHHQLPEFTQTHAHRVGDAIQLSHPLSSPSPPSFNLSKHQGLFQ